MNTTIIRQWLKAEPKWDEPLIQWWQNILELEDILRRMKR